MNQDISPKPKAEFDFNRNIAIIIGINEYEGNSISNLGTPVNDAEALASLLEKKFGYDHVVRLINTEANLGGLKILLNETLPNELKPTEHDRLIFYFAGHGIPKNSDEGPKGYLVPQDAQLGKVETFLPMQELRDSLEKLECHHLLIILDCCFAGQFRWASTRKLTVVWDEIHREHYDRFIRYPAWQVITSSAYDQEALDQVKLSQDSRGIEENTKHSPFALALLEALGDESNADYTGDGVITAQELIVYLEERLAKLSKERQVPDLYPLKREYDKGQFIFVDPTFSPDNLSPAPELNPENNPYRGLSSFEEQHARFFFGREKLISELCNRLANYPNNCPLIAVLGVSGSGKSSLVKAGLVPKLREQSEQDKESRKWCILEPIRPGLLPFTELAKVFLPIINPELLTDLNLNQVSFFDEKQKDIDIQQLAKKWSSATNEGKLLLILDYYEELKNFCQESEKFSALHNKINETLGIVINEIQTKSEFLKEKIVEWVKNNPETRILLVIDQFEELITLAQSDSKSNQSGSDSELSEWQKFLEFLKVILRECSQNLRIIVTLRSDFEPRFINSPLKDYWNDARFPVRAMNSDELREAIAGPAEKQALSFQPDELVGQLVDEVGQMPGALPLLSFTLSELYIKLYERNKAGGVDRALQGEDYKALGGVAGALTRRATEEYDNLLKDFGKESGKAYQATMRRLMLRMVSLEGGATVRRRVLDSELIYDDDAENERVNTIKDRLVAARLLVKGQENGVSYVEPAHDFLVRGWDKLQDWIRGEQENLSLQQRLTIAAVEWQSQKNGESNTSKVEPVINWVDQSLFTVENLLNQVSLKLVSIVKRSQNQQGQTKEKSVQFLWDSNPYLKVLDQKLESDQHWLNAVETEFVKESVLQKRRGVSWRWRIAIAVMLGLSGLTIAALIGQRQALINQMDSNRQASETNLQSNKLVLDTLISSLKAGVELKKPFLQLIKPEEHIQNQVVNNLRRAVYSVKEYERLENFPSVDASFWGKDGMLIIASIDQNNTVKIFDKQGVKLAELPVQEASGSKIVFNADGDKLAIRTSSGIIHLWDWKKKLTSVELKGSPGDSVKSLAFSPDSSKLISVIANYNGKYSSIAQLWNLSSQQPQKIEKPLEEIEIIAAGFNQDNQLRIVAITTDNRQIGIWDYSLGKKGKNLYSNIFDFAVDNIVLSPDSNKLVVTYGYDSKEGNTTDVIFLNSSDDKPLALGKDNIVAFSPDSNKLATTDANKGIISLRVRGLFSSVEELKTYPIEIKELKYSFDGKQLLIGFIDNTIQIWNLESELSGLNPIKEFQGSFENVIFSNNGKQLVAITKKEDLQGSKISLLDLSGNQLSEFEGQYKPDSLVSFNLNLKKLAISESSSHQVNLLDFSTTPITIKKPIKKDQIKKIGFSPDGKQLAIINTNNNSDNLEIIDLLNNKNYPPLSLGYEYEYVEINWSHDNKLLLNLNNDESLGAKTLNFWILSEGNYLKPLNSLPLKDKDLDFDNVNLNYENDLVVMNILNVGNNKPSAVQTVVQIWDLSLKKLLFELIFDRDDKIKNGDHRIKKLSLSPNGQMLITVSYDGMAKLWQIDGLDELLTKGCNHVREYLKNSPNIKNDDRHLCDKIPS